MDKRETARIAQELVRAGWKVSITGHCHWKCVPPDKTKKVVYMSLTPSDRRALKAIRMQLRHSGYDPK